MRLKPVHGHAAGEEDLSDSELAGCGADMLCAIDVGFTIAGKRADVVAMLGCQVDENVCFPR
jgi:hypothetical protein